MGQLSPVLREELQAHQPILSVPRSSLLQLFTSLELKVGIDIIKSVAS